MTFDNISKHENRCEEDTKAFIHKNRNIYGKSWTEYEKLYWLLYRLSCCYWGCHGGSHAFEHLAGKTITTISVAQRAMFNGYYDESLALIRNVGEIANLVNLFWQNPETIPEWINAQENGNSRLYRPAKVRIMLENLNVLIPFNKDHYDFLCRTAVHPRPHHPPNTYGDDLQPILGLVFQEEGFRVNYWNLLWATSVISGPVAKCAILKQSVAEEIVELSVSIFSSARDKLPYISR